MRIENEGVIVGPADGKDLANPIGGGMVVKIRDGDTAGAYSVHDNAIPPSLRDPASTVATRRPSTYWRES